MSSELTVWLAHPFTLALASAALMLLFLVTEVLLRSLAEMGNVRFQGVLEDHKGLLPAGVEAAFPLARLLDTLRWLQVLTVGLLWLVVFSFAGLSLLQALVLSLLVPVVLVVVSFTAFGAVGEEWVALLLRLVRPPVWPLLALLARIGSPPAVLAAEPEEEEASEREIQAYVEVGQAAGIIEAEEGEFFESLVEFFDTVAREVMTPRTEMVAVPDTLSFGELLETFSSTRKSRIPVYQDTVDHVIGVVHVKDVVEYLKRGEQPPLSELVRDCLVVPESKPLGELLGDFQQQHQQLAIIVDEYGGTAGLVTLEDVVEEIVGEIQDEYDPKQVPEWQELSEGVYRIQARGSVEILEELFDVEINEEGVDTVGGLVFSRYGTVPDSGAEVVDDVHRLHFIVDEMDERRIVSVTVRSLSPADGQEG